MPITGPIPLPDSGMDEFLKQLQIGQENRREQERLKQSALANEQLNKYRQSELGISQGRLDLEKELGPLRLNLLREKIKAAQHEGLPELTKTNITKNQGIIQNVENLIPQIDELTSSDFPGQTVGKYIHPSAQADYDAKIASLSDTLLGAYNLPKTDQSLHLVQQMVRQKPFETRDAYKSRIENLKNDLLSRKERASKYLKNKNVLGIDEEDLGKGNIINNKENKKSESENENNLSPPPEAEVEIYNPQGQLVAYGTKKVAEKFLLKHKGHYQKVIKRG
jgi:hypothetical protein